MIAVLLLYGLVAIAAGALGKRLGRSVLLLGAVAPAVTFVWALFNARSIVEGNTISMSWSWVPGLGLEASFLIDSFALLFVLLVSGIGVLIMVYATWYFANSTRLGPLAAYLVLFAGSMLGLVTADNLLVLFVFWELTAITSYLLIGFEDKKAEARDAARKALLVTGFGGLVMLAGIVMLGIDAGTYSMSGILASPPSSAITGAALLLVLVGAFTKSAQVPFHFWLPGAMAAPTPVSAYLHSATMVKAGIYLIARLSPSFAPLFAYWRPLVIGVGLLTMLVGGYKALRQNDAKLILAYGTVSQLGLITALVGAGTPKLAFAGTAVILAHALYKAALFMVIGVVDHQAHTRDIRKLSGLARALPVTFWVAALSMASYIGLPPLFGFIAKEVALEGFRLSPFDGSQAAFFAVVLASAITTAYGARFMWGVFGTKPSQRSNPSEHIARPNPMLVVPAALLTVLTVAYGLAPQWIEPLISAAGASLSPPENPFALVLWAGFVPSLAWSAVAVGVGLLLFWQRDAVERLQAVTDVLPSADRAYDRTIDALNRTAREVTAHLQVGSLPVYGGVIFGTIAVVTGAMLLLAWPNNINAIFADSSWEIAVAAFVIVAAIGTAIQKRRIAAVLLLGAVGYGVAVIFVMYGAPDLAITQLLFETLALVLFILVVRRLPDHFSKGRQRFGKASRIVIAGSVGVFVGVFALIAATSRQVESVGFEMAARALPDAGGRNVVNVILTDFRALDTLGEITVLVVAAIGILALVRPDGRDRR